MKKVIFVILLIVAGISVALYAFLSNRSTNISVPVATQTPTISITPSVTPFCFASNITTSIDSEGTAELTYLKLRIKNNANVTCQIQSDNLIEITVQDHPKNMSQVLKTDPEQYVLILAPQSEVYAQVGFPNGKQCTATVSKSMQVQYRISPDESLSFTSPKALIQSCSDEKEVTTIDVWSWSQEPITPIDTTGYPEPPSF